MDALSQGKTYAEIQSSFGCSSATIAAISKRMADYDEGVVAKLMTAKTLRALDAWEQAMETGAKNGKHAPAKDWLIHSKVLSPVTQGGESRIGVAVIIGTPGQPIDLPSVQVIDTSVDSSDDGA